MARAELEEILKDESKLNGISKVAFDVIDTNNSGYID